MSSSDTAATSQSAFIDQFDNADELEERFDDAKQEQQAQRDEQLDQAVRQQAQKSYHERVKELRSVELSYQPELPEGVPEDAIEALEEKWAPPSHDLVVEFFERSISVGVDPDTDELADEFDEDLARQNIGIFQFATKALADLCIPADDDPERAEKKTAGFWSSFPMVDTMALFRMAVAERITDEDMELAEEEVESTKNSQ